MGRQISTFFSDTRGPRGYHTALWSVVHPRTRRMSYNTGSRPKRSITTGIAVRGFPNIALSIARKNCLHLFTSFWTSLHVKHAPFQLALQSQRIYRQRTLMLSKHANNDKFPSTFNSQAYDVPTRLEMFAALLRSPNSDTKPWNVFSWSLTQFIGS